MTISAEQVRAARRLLGWSIKKLAGHPGVEFIAENGGGAGVRLRERGRTIEFR